jgi:hypothetical protein
VNTDAKKKSCFMRGLNTKIEAALVTCYNATYHEVVNVAIASEEKSRIHKESKKKKQVLSSSSGGIKKAPKVYLPPSESFLPSLSSIAIPSSSADVYPSCHNLAISTTAECPWYSKSEPNNP